MGGKVSLMLVLAFSGLFALLGKNLLDFQTTATENYVDYYSETIAHNIAVSGANMAANQIYINKFWGAGYSNLPMSDGILDLSVTDFGLDNKMITSVGYYNGIKDTVLVRLAPKNFAQYGNFYNKFFAWAATGDTFRGPFHTNDWLQCYGDPVFMGYTTTKKGVKKYNSKSHPEFHGGLDEGVSIPLEFDTSTIRQAAFDGGKIFTDTTGTNKELEVKIVLNSDGTATYSWQIGSGGWSSPQTKALSMLAPNGVIYVEKGNVFLEGTLSGQLSIVASRKGAGVKKAGVVYITDDIKYNINPLTNPSSTDMLGIIAEDHVIVEYNPGTGDLDIQASIYSQADGLEIEDYDKYPSAHNMNILGGVIGERVLPTAKYKWDGTKYVPTNGYSYVHQFDSRFFHTVPPYFPKTKYYKIVSWYE